MAYLSGSLPTAGRSTTGVVKSKQSPCPPLLLPSLIWETNAASQTHILPDLDGEIYLTTRSFADVNDDGQVNILDLIEVTNSLGKSAPDPNGDGVVNILDLMFVAQQFSQ